MLKGYEMVVGLEIHVELKTQSKAFCACATAYGAAPNTQVCPVCLGLPGALPVLNEQAVADCVKAGLALNCRINPVSRQDRKNYFYPDLPKAYQISQYDVPLCGPGHLTLPEGKTIGITRIHLEEDAGKLIHTEEGTLIDFNRCGVPLIEIVTEPDIRSPQEAAAFLKALRTVLIYTGISDCKMNEGSMRCDVNLSLRRPGEPLGTRTEMKNLNSFQSVSRAIAFEAQRQAQVLAAGGEVHQETRRFDQATGETYLMRRKENADDYRFFPDPDLKPIMISDEMIETLRRQLPPLPGERMAKYQKWGLTLQQSELLTQERAMADYFEAVCESLHTAQRPAAARLLLAEGFRLHEEGEKIPVAAEHLAQIVNMLSAGQISATAAKACLCALWEKDQDPQSWVQAQGLYQTGDEQLLTDTVRAVLLANPGMVAGYKKGKTNLSQALMGQCMARLQGRGNPQKLMEILLTELTKTP